MKNAILTFTDGSEIELPVNKIVSTNEGNGMQKTAYSVSTVVPANDMVLIVGYGITTLLTVMSNPDQVSLKSKFMVVGAGTTVDYEKYDVNIGDQVQLRSHDEYQLFKTIDNTNKLSIESLTDLAKNEKGLLAAVAIAREKDKSKLGINMVSQVQISADLMKKIKANEHKTAGKDLIYRGKELPFLNYYLTHPSNIIGIVQTPKPVTNDNTAT